MSRSSSREHLGARFPDTEIAISVPEAVEFARLGLLSPDRRSPRSISAKEGVEIGVLTVGGDVTPFDADQLEADAFERREKLAG